MAMNGLTLGNAIGTAFFDAIPESVKACMTPTALADTCTSLMNSATVIANCIVSHIISCAEVSVTVDAGIGVQVTPSTGTGVTSTAGTGTGTIS